MFEQFIHFAIGAVYCAFFWCKVRESSLARCWRCYAGHRPKTCATWHSVCSTTERTAPLEIVSVMAR